MKWYWWALIIIGAIIIGYVVADQMAKAKIKKATTLPNGVKDVTTNTVANSDGSQTTTATAGTAGGGKIVSVQRTKA